MPGAIQPARARFASYKSFQGSRIVRGEDLAGAIKYRIKIRQTRTRWVSGAASQRTLCTKTCQTGAAVDPKTPEPVSVRADYCYC